jgi:glycosyltransferase involved in cell wall biosynthesis
LIKQRKIAVVGPTPPIRSGIARHTVAIARALVDREDLTIRVWSFSRQYPKFLYPGAAERAEDGVPPSDLQMRFSIDGVRRTANEIRDWGPDLLVLPAWTFFLAPALGWIARQIRRDGVECCVVVHNAFDHETKAWKAKLNLWQLAQADRYVTHNYDLAARLGENFPKAKVDVFPHPVFNDFPEPTGALPREAALELLFFGLVRPYKGLDLALDAAAKSGRADLRLTIAGEFWQGLDETRERISRLGLSDQVELIPRYVSDAETAELFDRADAVVLPYRSVTGSGVIPTAYRYGRAVIATDLPGLAAVVRHDETGWLTPLGDVDALATTIRGLDRETTSRVGEAARAFGSTLSWDRFADLVLGET